MAEAHPIRRGNRFKDLSGLRFGRLLVMEASGYSGQQITWRCQCDCGTERVVRGQDLRSGNTQSCGCLRADILRGPRTSPGHMGRFRDLTGQVFGEYTIIQQAPVTDDRVRWHCRCSCGTERIVLAQSLTRGQSTSCGCMRHGVRCRSSGVDMHGQQITRHTHSAERGVYRGMFTRCYNTRVRAYRLYGGRGIRVCASWTASFAAFLSDVGLRPSPAHSLDRKDNNGNYSCGKCAECIDKGWPANCRWATKKEQAQNTRRSRFLTLNGETLNITEWSRRTGISDHTIRVRIEHLGWTVEKALTTPVKRRVAT
jgi:hypothetical protein